MQLTRQTSLLFLLNLMDAVLTIYWVRNGFATEGNHLMAGLLDLGDMPFLTVKIAVGAVTAFVLSYWGDYRLARYGVTFALAAYIGLMLVHFLTGLTAIGLISAARVNEFSAWSNGFYALIF